MLKGLGWQRQRGFLGFDLGATAIRVAEVVGRWGRWRLLEFAVQPLARGAWRDGVPLDKDRVVEALKTLVAGRGWERRAVLASLGGSRLITRLISLPAMPRADLEKAVYFYAEQYLPFGLAEISLDYTVLAKETKGREKKLHILVAAVSREIAHTYEDLFAAAGLKLVALDIVPLALMRVLKVAPDLPGKAAKAVAALDIGYSTCHLVVIQGGRVEFCRAFPEGWGEAEAGAVFTGQPVTTEVGGEGRLPRWNPALQAPLSGVVQEVRRSLEFLRSQGRQVNVEEIYLAGGLGLLTEVERFLEAELGLPVRSLASALGLEPGAEVALGTALGKVVA